MKVLFGVVLSVCVILSWPHFTSSLHLAHACPLVVLATWHAFHRLLQVTHASVLIAAKAIFNYGVCLTENFSWLISRHTQREDVQTDHIWCCYVSSYSLLHIQLYVLLCYSMQYRCALHCQAQCAYSLHYFFCKHNSVFIGIYERLNQCAALLYVMLC